MNGNYVTLGVALAVWVGLFVFLLRLDTRVKKLEENK
jgi:CcmD family protein